MTLTIGILECGENRAEWLAEHGHLADWFKPFLSNAASVPLQYRTFKVHADQLPECVDDADAWLITGSPASVYEHPSWQAALTDFLLEAAVEKPIIGICYGHQLMHQIMGGSVEEVEQWGIGVHEYDVVHTPTWVAENDKLSSLRILASHQDQVTSAAPNTKILASSKFCPIAVSLIGNKVLTMQAHPELTPELARVVYAFRREIQGDELTDRAIDSTSNEIDADVFGRWIVRFVNHVNECPSDLKEHTDFNTFDTVEKNPTDVQHI